MKIEKILQKTSKVAVVGASVNKKKWGYKVYRALKPVFPRFYAVNPKYGRIEDDRCYPDLESLPEKPDIVLTVVPPKATEYVVKACKSLGVKKVWMQPGSESEKAIRFCKDNGIEAIHGLCLVVDGLKGDRVSQGKK